MARARPSSLRCGRRGVRVEGGAGGGRGCLCPEATGLTSLPGIHLSFP